MSDASGAVSGGAALTTFAISGEVLRITTDPGATAPTTLYDAVINDVDGFDVGGGLLANRSATVTESVGPVANATGSSFFVDGTLELVISNAGNAKVGMVRLYYR